MPGKPDIDWCAYFPGLNASSTNHLLPCPFHNEEDPSLSLNTEEGIFHCFGCGSEGGIKDFLALWESKGASPIEVGASGTAVRKKKSTDNRNIPDERIEEYRRNLEKSIGVKITLKTKRGLTDETLKRFRVGYDRETGRYTIPLYNLNGVCVNIRKYRMGAKKAKFTNYEDPEEKKKGKDGISFGKAEIYNVSILSESDIVIIAEGELDCILLCQLGLPAISFTGGADTIPDDVGMLQDCTCIIAYDVDKSGKTGAKKLQHALRNIAKFSRVVDLGGALPEGGDVTDFFLRYGEEKLKQELGFAALNVTLNQILVPENFGKYLQFDARVVGRDLDPFMIPYRYRLICNAGSGKKCDGCPMMAERGYKEIFLHPDDPDILECVLVKRIEQETFLRERFVHCKLAEVQVIDYVSVDRVRLRPPGLLRSSDISVNLGYIWNAAPDSNKLHRMTGKILPEPKNQYATLFVGSIAPLEEEKTDLDKDEVKKLRGIFSTSPDKIEEKINWLCEQEARVTGIFCREEIHIAVDLVTHSVLDIIWRDSVAKGWVEGLVAGDTREGKSDTAKKLLSFYGVGDVISSENASFAGLIGGVSQVGNAWHLTWGATVQNTRGMIVIDETQGMERSDIGKMSSQRSSGIAEIIKIRTERAEAKTRILWIGNPKKENKNTVRDYAYPVVLAKELLGRAEDIARLDFMVGIRSGDAPQEDQDRERDRNVQLVLDSKICQRLIHWIWSRTPEEVVFSDETIKQIETSSRSLIKDYGASDIPLIKPAEQPLIMARLAASIAAHLFSTPDGVKIEVLPEHVVYIENFLRKCFTSPTLRFSEYVESKLKGDIVLNRKEVSRELIKIGAIDVAENLLMREYLLMSDFEDLFAMMRAEARKLVSLLVRNNAIRRSKTGYAKSEGFNTILRGIRDGMITLDTLMAEEKKDPPF